MGGSPDAAWLLLSLCESVPVGGKRFGVRDCPLAVSRNLAPLGMCRTQGLVVESANEPAQELVSEVQLPRLRALAVGSGFGGSVNLESCHLPEPVFPGVHRDSNSIRVESCQGRALGTAHWGPRRRSPKGS